MGNKKILSEEIYTFNNKSIPIYKTKKGIRLIKINNIFYNINDKSINEKIKKECFNDFLNLELNEDEYVII
jgi:hypothetical protein